MNDDMQNAYDHDGRQDTPAEELNVVNMNEQHQEPDTMGLLSEQIDGLIDDVKDKEPVQVQNEDNNKKSLLDE